MGRDGMAGVAGIVLVLVGLMHTDGQGAGHHHAAACVHQQLAGVHRWYQ
jgi:hypothetical protein